MRDQSPRVDEQELGKPIYRGPKQQGEIIQHFLATFKEALVKVLHSLHSPKSLSSGLSAQWVLWNSPFGSSPGQPTTYLKQGGSCGSVLGFPSCQTGIERHPLGCTGSWSACMVSMQNIIAQYITFAPSERGSLICIHSVLCNRHLLCSEWVAHKPLVSNVWLGTFPCMRMVSPNSLALGHYQAQMCAAADWGWIEGTKELLL